MTKVNYLGIPVALFLILIIAYFSLSYLGIVAMARTYYEFSKAPGLRIVRISTDDDQRVYVGADVENKGSIEFYGTNSDNFAKGGGYFYVFKIKYFKLPLDPKTGYRLDSVNDVVKSYDAILEKARR